MKLTRPFVYFSLMILLLLTTAAGPFDAPIPLPPQSKSVYKLIIERADTGEAIGTGTGWVGENKEGEIRIVSNAHVCVDNGLEINAEVGVLTNIRLDDGRKLKRFIFDPFHDVCLLAIEGDISKEVPLHLAAKPTNIMDRVTVIGHPQGRPLEAAAGYRIDSTLIPLDLFEQDYVLAYGEQQWCMTLPNSTLCMYLRQSDTYRIRIEPGNSGSPLINEAGEVVGLVWGMATFNNTTLAASLDQLRPFLK